MPNSTTNYQYINQWRENNFSRVLIQNNIMSLFHSISTKINWVNSYVRLKHSLNIPNIWKCNQFKMNLNAKFTELGFWFDDIDAENSRERKKKTDDNTFSIKFVRTYID